MGGLGSLQSLNLGGNQLTGDIPPELGSLASLQSLNLGGNQLTGDIPPELGGLASLQSLNLESNQLTGSISPELGGLGSLQSLNLTDNQLSGDIPDELSGLGSLQSLNLTDNQLGCIPDFLRDVAVGELPVCTPEDHPGDTEALIALHNAWGQPGLENWLSRVPIGEWEGVSVDSNGRVTALNLAGKGLSGEISPEVGRLESLQVLDLSDNALTGELPPELGSLESLRVLYLAETRLTGGGKCVPNVAALSLPISALAPLGELCVTGGEFASVSAGRSYACGVRTDGSVACWGNDEYGETTPPEGSSLPSAPGTTTPAG